MIRTGSGLVLVMMLGGSSTAQRPSEWKDDIADKMAGTWKLEGTLAGRERAHHAVVARWVAGHQFLEIDEHTTPEAPPTESRYDALWFLGHDDVSERYVLHLIDVYGGRFSETLGYGTRQGNTISFVFEYPDGPFHTVWRWLPDSQSWEWHMEQKGPDGKWTTFGDFKLTRS